MNSKIQNQLPVAQPAIHSHLRGWETSPQPAKTKIGPKTMDIVHPVTGTLHYTQICWLARLNPRPSRRQLGYIIVDISGT